MTAETLSADALQFPLRCIAYFISQQFASLTPRQKHHGSRFVLLRVKRFACAGYCALDWNRAAEPAMRLSAEALADAVSRTEGYSFTYLKELRLSATMAWVAAPERV